MELMEGGNLSELIESQFYLNKLIPEATLRTIAIRIFEAVSYLHQNQVVHRDLKP